MSKNLHPFAPVFVALLLILQFFTISQAQDIEASVKISVAKKISADIKVMFSKERPAVDSQNVWFLDDYAGVSGLTNRLSTVYVYDRQGFLIARKKFTVVDQLRLGNIGGFRYTVDLTQLGVAAAAAHISWLASDGGMIMLDDLLPQMMGKSAKITFEVPSGWKIYHAETEEQPNVFSVSNIEKAVFYFGRDIREREIKIGKSTIKLGLSGDWFFTGDDASTMIKSIAAEYEKILGQMPNPTSRISINKFPYPIAPGNWEADTRGRSVTIVSSDMPFKTQSKQRLHEQLRHEMFHLWMPNGVNLSGNYDWFYEGFALYQSLRTGVATNTIGFDNFLDTLSRAYSIDGRQSTMLSLIDASKNRFSGANTQVYARGMLVAFLCDIALLQNSKGKRSVENLLHEIYQKHHNSESRADGNEAVLAAFAKYPELRPITERYITGNSKVEWAEYLQMGGLEMGGTRSALEVSKKLSSRQKDLLDKLGYNTWRKLSKDSK